MRAVFPPSGCWVLVTPHSRFRTIVGAVCRGSQGSAVFMRIKNLAPQVGLEPTTLRLTAECSAIELLRSVLCAKLSNTKVAESAQCVKIAHSFLLAKTTGI